MSGLRGRAGSGRGGGTALSLRPGRSGRVPHRSVGGSASFGAAVGDIAGVSVAVPAGDAVGSESEPQPAAAASNNIRARTVGNEQPLQICHTATGMEEPPAKNIPYDMIQASGARRTKKWYVWFAFSSVCRPNPGESHLLNDTSEHKEFRQAISPNTPGRRMAMYRKSDLHRIAMTSNTDGLGWRIRR